MRAAIYTRISDARDDDTAGVDRQEEDCRALVAKRGWDVADVYCDNNRSAIKGVRPEYRRLLDDAKAGEVDAVVTWASDRLYRRLTDLEEIASVLGDIEVVTVKSGTVDLSTATGRMQAEFLGVVAKHESAQRGERVARAARQRAEAGKFGGGVRRFGYAKGMKSLEPVEAEAVREAYQQVIQGVPLRRIAQEWTTDGLRGPSGAEITPMTLRGILLRPGNAGLAVYRGEIVGRTMFPSIVDEATFRQVVARLTDPRRRTTPADSRQTLLTGVLVCGVCGGPVRAHMRRTQRNGTPRPSYACHKSRCVTRSRARLDEAISELVMRYLIKHRDSYRQAPRTASKAAQRASREAAGYRKQLEDLAALMGSGQLDPVDYAAGTRGLRERLAEAESRVARHAGTPATAKFLQAEDVAAAWDAAVVDTRRAVIREVVESITLPPGTPGRFTMAGTAVVWRAGADRDRGSSGNSA